MDAEQLTINTIRLLAADMVQAANSGHPGLPLGASPMAYAAFSGMRINGKNPGWADRDRFVLSAGHGSAMLYAILHVFGYDLSLEDLKAFRQFDSKTPGHPEYGETPGVDISTGPLGQGVANAVGMALAETFLAAHFNRPGCNIVDHYTYALCGDGCLMQGVSNEAASLAGTLGLGKLILLYDSNNISIEGSTDIAFAEDTAKRFEALGWDVQKVEDGNDLGAIRAAIAAAKAVTDKPSMIEVKTVIGFGAPNKAGKPSAHGEPLGAEELALTKAAFGFNPQTYFHVPEQVTEHMNALMNAQVKSNDDWDAMLTEYRAAYPELALEWERWQNGWVPDFMDDENFWAFTGDMETRTVSQKIMNYISKQMPNLLGGSADLSPSNKSAMTDREYYSRDNRGGSNIHFGAREFSMTAISNGMLAHGGLRPYAAEFFVFSDYMKPALRMAALMKLPLIAVLTHDSIGVGEDGPTHQPVEQLAALRSIPNLTVIRPADGKETAAAWQLALSRKHSPTALVLTRQKTKGLAETGKGALRGGYILRDTQGTPDLILIAAGSEAELALAAADELAKQNIAARVVSMPSFEIFDEQDAGYRESVLPRSVTKRMSIEAGTSFGWHKYIGSEGIALSVDSFGKSGKYERVFEAFGFTVENAVNAAVRLVGGQIQK